MLGVYKLGSKSKQSFSFGIHTVLFQAEIYAIIKACIMENSNGLQRQEHLCSLQ
jgi:hypothetical protein